MKSGAANHLVRRLPYPYRCALTISNDADYCQMPFFEELMRFLNTRHQTAFGQGLGLEVTSSYFAFSPPERQFAFFGGLEPEAPRGKYANRVAEYLTAGWIDANHAYGDFDGIGGFTRKHAERTFESLNALGVQLGVFINHGDDRNVQCIGSEGPHHQGDVRGSSAYHSDLLFEHGTKFITSSVYAYGDASQDGHAAKLGGQSRSVLSFRKAKENPNPILLTPVCLRDGTRFQAFARLRGTGFNAPNLSSLAYHVSRANIDQLYETGGVIVLYQHLGVISRIARKCIPASVDAVRSMSHLLAPLRALGREAEEGRLWIGGLQRMLQYFDMIGSVTVDCNEGEFSIDIQRKLGDAERFFGGLTLYCHPQSLPKIRFKDLELPLQHNGPDETGQYSVSVRMSRLPDIW
jgi:hypothetical protein